MHLVFDERPQWFFSVCVCFFECCQGGAFRNAILFKSYFQIRVQMKYVKGKLYMKENCMLSFAIV